MMYLEMMYCDIIFHNETLLISVTAGIILQVVFIPEQDTSNVIMLFSHMFPFLACIYFIVILFCSSFLPLENPRLKQSTNMSSNCPRIFFLLILGDTWRVC